MIHMGIRILKIHIREQFELWFIFVFISFYVRLFDYSVLFKAGNSELIHELITLHNHELM